MTEHRKPLGRLLLGASLVLLTSGCSAATMAAAPTQRAQTDAATATDDMMLPVRHDAATGRVYLTVREMGEEMLYLNTLATGLGTAGLDRGQLGTSGVVRFERHGNRVHLLMVNHDHRAVGGDEAARRAVEESFPNSIVASFPIESDGPGGTVVDATDFFLTDVYDAASNMRRTGATGVRIDAGRSFVDTEYTRAFPINTEVRSVLTYVTDSPSRALSQHAPDGRSVTLAQHHSFLRLPENPLEAREFDPRAGNFTNSYFDFAQPFDADYRRRAVARWRLVPSDTAAYLRGDLTEPVTPIVYYLDRGVPEPYRSAFIEGGNWWNGVFEAAGWRNAFRVELMPEGVDPMDARYPAIYWVHRQERGSSVGPSYRDPRTGEILSTVVRMDSYRSLVDFDIYMGLIPAAGASGLAMTPEDFVMARRRQHMAHEIGHTLGLSHNYAAATQGRASVMDYPYPLIRVEEDGRIDISEAYRPSAGAHDTLAIRYAYTWYPDEQAEAAGLKKLVRDAEASGLHFVADADADESGSFPEATRWVEGPNMIEALQRTMAVRERLMEAFDTRAAQTGEPLAVLNRRFSHVYLHHRFALEGATKTVGGMRYGYALAGEATQPTEVIPAEEQRRALSLVLSALQPEALRIPTQLTATIPPIPYGYDGDLTPIESPTGRVFDPLGTAHSLSQEIVDRLLHPERAARMVTFHAMDPAIPGLDEVLGALVSATWGRRSTASVDSQDPALRRVAQRATLDAMLDLAGHGDATAEVTAITELHLSRLRDRLDAASSGPDADIAHREAAVRDIERYFDGEDDPEDRPRPGLIPIPWA